MDLRQIARRLSILHELAALYRDRMELRGGSARQALSAACAAPDHVKALFSVTELDRWSYSVYFARSFSLSPNSCSSWGRLLSPLAIDYMSFAEGQRCVREPL